MNINYKDIAIRAAKTFLQAFLATLAVGVLTVETPEAGKALLIACFASGISALQNWIKNTL